MQVKSHMSWCFVSEFSFASNIVSFYVPCLLSLPYSMRTHEGKDKTEGNGYKI